MIIEKMRELYKKHPIAFSAIVGIILLIGIPLFVQAMYHAPARCKILEEKIPPGNLLAYIGTVLTFMATFSLSLNVYDSNKEQTERMKLIENKAVLSINNEKNIEVDLLNPRREKLDDIFMEMEWNVLSDAIISKIVIKNLSIEDLEHPRERNKQFYKKYESGENVRFKYQDNKSKIKVTLDIQDERAQNILRKDHQIGISGDFDIYCEDVKTYATMNIMCWSYKENEDIVAHMKYEIQSSSFFSHSAKLC